MRSKGTRRLSVAILLVAGLVLLIPASSMAAPYPSETAGLWNEIHAWVLDFFKFFDKVDRVPDPPSTDYGPYADPTG